MARRLSAFGVALLVCACGGREGGGGYETASVDLRGAVEKGPFIVQSSIEVSLLDPNLNPTGTVFNEQTINDRGEFAIHFEAAGPVAVKGEGYYYNEITGDTSGSTLTLRALYIPSGSGVQNAYVNIVTHLTTPRVTALVQGGMEFSAAVEQAESELLASLAITAPSYALGTSGVHMNLAGADNDDNAYLLAVSSVLTQVAVNRGGSIDGKVQEVLNEFSTALATGSLTDAQRSEVSVALPQVMAAVVQADLSAYMRSKGGSGTVPDMNRVLDQDRDGLANANDNCPFVANPGQENGDGDAHGDACDDCPSTVCADECLPVSQYPALNADLCITSCNTALAGPCQAGVCITVTGSGGVSANLCAPSCDPLSPDCEEGTLCGYAAGEVGRDLGEAVWACTPEGLHGETGVGEVCSSVADCAAGLACLLGGWPSGSFGLCLQPCDPDSPALCGNQDCTEVTDHDLAGEVFFACGLPPGELGDPCVSAESCADGLACMGPGTGSCSNNAPCCQPAGGQGEPCLEEMTCHQGFVCTHLTRPGDCLSDAGPCCLAGGGYLQRCGEGNPQCDPGLQCADTVGCPPDLDMCCALATTGIFQAACTDGTCPAGLTCTSSGCPFPTADCCLPDGTGGAFKPCTEGACDTNLACVDLSAAGGCTNGLLECCLPAGDIAQPCLDGTCTGADLTCMTTGCPSGLPDCCLPPACPCEEYPGTECVASFQLCGSRDSCCLPVGGDGEPCAMGEPTCEEGLECMGPELRAWCNDVHGEGCCLAAGGAGEPCRNDRTCDEGLACDEQDWTCVEAGGLDQPCYIDRTCDEGFVCTDDWPSTCVAAGGLDEPCYSDHTCDEGLVCNGDRPATCVAAGGLGELCLSGGVCDPGLSCTFSDQECPDRTACCLLVGLGRFAQACDASACATGLTCVNDGCPWDTDDCCMAIETGGENESCELNGGCDNNDLVCAAGCDNGLPECCRPAGRTGEPCRESGPACDGSLVCSTTGCSNGAASCCLPPPCDISAPGSCIRANGQLCTNLWDGTCDMMSSCCYDAGDIGEMCFPGPPACVDGAACATSDACGELETCCLTSGGVGEPCNPDRSCDSPYSTSCTTGTACPDGLSSCCLEAGGLNEPCYSDNTCDSPTTMVCVWHPEGCEDLGLSSCCRLSGDIGEPCNNDGTCDDPESSMCTTTPNPLCLGDRCCIPTGGLDEPCNRDGSCDAPVDTSCVLTSHCGDYDRGCCRSTGARGEPCNTDGTCDNPTVDTCAASTMCTAGSPCCLQAGGSNQPCHTDGSCDGGLTCGVVCSFGLTSCCR